MGIGYNVRQTGGVTVVDLSGRITLDDTTAPRSDLALHELIRGLVKHGYKDILLNLRDVTHLDNSGIGELFSSFTAVRNQCGVLKLTNPTERVGNLLRLTKLDTVLDVIENESTAVHSFLSSPTDAGPVAVREEVLVYAARTDHDGEGPHLGPKTEGGNAHH
jgi:anti-sigma B factor antagonist